MDDPQIIRTLARELVRARLEAAGENPLTYPSSFIRNKALQIIRNLRRRQVQQPKTEVKMED